MTYTPINMQIYIQAYTGALAGMSGAGLWNLNTAPTATDASSVGAAVMAQAYAQEFDILFDASGLPVDCFSAEATKTLSLGAFWQRNPAQNIPPASYSVPILNVLALIGAGEANFAQEGISIPTCCCEGQ